MRSATESRCNESPVDSDEAVSHRSDLLAFFAVVLGCCCRAWFAHATFFNTDEAWHFSVANQASLAAAYRASLTLWHPPLLICVLYFWKSVGTSNLVLRLPCVIAGSAFCWIYFRWMALLFNRRVAWLALLFVTFLPTMVRMSAELRQYPFLLMFAAASGYFLDRAFHDDSAKAMLFSSVCLWLAMLSHYSGFLFAAALGAYALIRMFREHFSFGTIAAWILGQAGGIALALFLYFTQIAGLRAASGAQPLHQFADWYLHQFYYHPGTDNLALMIFRGTFGIFRFIFAWVVMGHVATLLFVAAIVLLFCKITPGKIALPPRLAAIWLLLPFLLSWIALATSLYPFGRTRHSIFLVIFAIAGVSITLLQIVRRNFTVAFLLTAVLVALCYAFGTQPWHDMLPMADSRRQNMDEALSFIRQNVSAQDVIYVNKSSEFQLAHYLCDQRAVDPDRSVQNFESFQCHGLRVISSYPNDDAVAIETFPAKWQEMARAFQLQPESRVWVFEGGWSTGFAEELKTRYSEFSSIRSHSFGHYLEIFSLPVQDEPGSSASPAKTK